MFARALIVLLLVLNLGVATWWTLRPDASPPPAMDVPGAAPRLQLLGEVSRRPPVPIAVALPAATPVSAPDLVTAAAPVAVQRCFAFGPFIDATALAAARAAVQSKVAQVRLREAAASGHGWRVWLPPLPDHEAAQAMAARISAAGFTDYYIVPGGEEANSIALGRYGSEDAAQRQRAVLQAAGFPAHAEAMGGTASWIDVIATSTFDAGLARKTMGAPQAKPLDCAKLQ